MQLRNTIHGKNWQVWQIVSYSPIHQNFPRQYSHIHRNVFGICTDCAVYGDIWWWFYFKCMPFRLYAWVSFYTILKAAN